MKTTNLALISYLDSLIFPILKYEQILEDNGYVIDSDKKVSGSKVFKIGEVKTIDGANDSYGSFLRNMEIKFQLPKIKNCNFEYQESEYVEWFAEVSLHVKRLNKSNNLKVYKALRVKLIRGLKIGDRCNELFRNLGITLFSIDCWDADGWDEIKKLEL